jgi:hypothetical protein
VGEWVDGWMDGNEWMNWKMVGWMGRFNEWMGKFNEWMGGQ